jgi:putative phosphoesterase
VRIGLLSDTHGFLDDAVFQHFAECDEIWHAGDFGTLAVLDRLKAFRPTRGVYGNVDGAELRACLPEDLVWQCEGIRVYMTHVGGYPGNYDRRAGKELRLLRPGLFVCGHAHILKVARDPALGLLHTNPGASGHHGWHLMRTLLRFTVESGKIRDMQAVELGPRGRRIAAGATRPEAAVL